MELKFTNHTLNISYMFWHLLVLTTFAPLPIEIKENADDFSMKIK